MSPLFDDLPDRSVGTDGGKRSLIGRYGRDEHPDLGVDRTHVAVTPFRRAESCTWTCSTLLMAASTPLVSAATKPQIDGHGFCAVVAIKLPTCCSDTPSVCAAAELAGRSRHPVAGLVADRAAAVDRPP